MKHPTEKGRRNSSEIILLINAQILVPVHSLRKCCACEGAEAVEGNTTLLLGWSSIPASQAGGSALPGSFPAPPIKCSPAQIFVAGLGLSLQEHG